MGMIDMGEPSIRSAENENVVNLVLIASGGGTDANAVMAAYNAGFISNCKIVGLFSTVAGAGCRGAIRMCRKRSAGQPHQTRHRRSRFPW